MKITILDDYRDTVRTLGCFSKVAHHNVMIWTDHTKDTDILAARLLDTEVLVLIRERTPLRAALLERLPNLRLVSHLGPYPHIDADACTRYGVILSSFIGGNRPSYATAELNWALMIAAMRRIPQEMAAMKTGKWQAWPVGLGLRGRTLGIFGYGRIGTVVAGYGRAFGMNVLVWGRETSLAKARADGYAVASSKAHLFEQSDVVSLHLKLIDETRGIVTAQDLARMKTSAVLVNTSRAGLIEPGALEEALRRGRPGMAALDVFDEEPLSDPNHPLLSMDNVVVTPHLGYVERDSLEGMFSLIFDQILAYERGQPINVANPEVLTKVQSRR
jgi:D-3-phosphoglycerate dehydrogenase / 2-oxoglutarate reductase